MKKDGLSQSKLQNETTYKMKVIVIFRPPKSSEGGEFLPFGEVRRGQ